MRILLAILLTSVTSGCVSYTYCNRSMLKNTQPPMTQEEAIEVIKPIVEKSGKAWSQANDMLFDMDGKALLARLKVGATGHITLIKEATIVGSDGMTFVYHDFYLTKTEQKFDWNPANLIPSLLLVGYTGRHEFFPVRIGYNLTYKETTNVWKFSDISRIVWVEDMGMSRVRFIPPTITVAGAEAASHRSWRRDDPFCVYHQPCLLRYHFELIIIPRWNMPKSKFLAAMKVLCPNLRLD